MPNLFLIAGPNGAGKSTSAPRLLDGPRRVDEFVNADVIAREQGLSDIAAGRQTLARIHALRRSGYQVDLTFFWLPSAEMAIQRVRQRVATGGHHIPEDVIRRRYERGLENFFNGYAEATDSWEFIDNTARSAARLIAWRVGAVVQVEDNSFWNQLLRRYMKPRAEEPAVEAPVTEESREQREWRLASDPHDKLRAVQHAIQEAIARHRDRGEPIVVWEGGKVTWLKPGEY